MVASSYPGWKEETSPGSRLVEGWKGTFIRECSGLKVGVECMSGVRGRLSNVDGPVRGVRHE